MAANRLWVSGILQQLGGPAMHGQFGFEPTVPPTSRSKLAAFSVPDDPSDAVVLVAMGAFNEPGGPAPSPDAGGEAMTGAEDLWRQ